MQKKLAIVGSHDQTRSLAPYRDESYDIWVFNEAAQNDWCIRWTACFQMHKPEVYQSLNNVNNRDHWNWLQKCHGRRVIWMQDYDEFVPCSRRYPLNEIIDMFPAAQPVPGNTFLTSTAAMALALALYQGYEHIEVYGVHLDSNTEYASQQACWLYWAGVARAILGDHFVLRSGEHLFKARVYGYDGEIQIDRAFFESRLSELDPAVITAKNRVFKLKDRVFGSITDFKPDDFMSLVVEAQEACMDLGVLEGRQSVAKACSMRTDPISAQQYERDGAQAQEDCAKSQSQTDKKSGIVEYVFNAWRLTQNPSAAAQLRNFTGDLLALNQITGQLQGIMEENKLYMGENNARLVAAGGVRTLRGMGMM